MARDLEIRELSSRDEVFLHTHNDVCGVKLCVWCKIVCVV